MKADIKHQHGHVFRIENIDIADLVTLLTHLYQFSPTTNLVINTGTNEVSVEAPDDMSDEDEERLVSEIYDPVLIALDDVIVTDELIDLLIGK